MGISLHIENNWFAAGIIGVVICTLSKPIIEKPLLFVSSLYFCRLVAAACPAISP